MSSPSDQRSDDYDPDADPDMLKSTTHQPNQAEGDDDSKIVDPAP
jgi:hypothetical protein